MSSLKKTAGDFLNFKVMAIAGVSSKGDTAGNIVFKKLLKHGYSVYPINPNREEIDGETCYPDIQSLPVIPDVVIIATHPDVTPDLIHDCGKSGVKWVWIHRSFGQGSYHPDAESIAKQYGISLIPGGCPMMFAEPDIIHKCMRWFLAKTGKEALPVIP
ncbi:MAG: CoA-binding protein [Balneolaceae bacterium]|nr:CoA-binding protein [Balneolaceae bacterium]